MSRISNIAAVIKGAGDFAEKALRKQLSIVRAGSTKRMSTFLTLSKSLKSEVVDRGNRITVVVTSPHKYAKTVLEDGGVKVDVPFSPGSGLGAENPSEYITGLALWAAQKFYGGNYQAGLKAAFRIARKQKGLTKTTYTNTGNPANPGWISEIKNDLDKNLVNYMRSNVMTAIKIDARSVLHRTI
jgi:hypothetical protein